MSQADSNHGNDRAAQSAPWALATGAGNIIGSTVVNHKDEALGRIKELMLDLRTGKVAYAVLSFGGLFGMGEKLFAVPWHALTLDTKRQCVILSVKKEWLSDAPGFDPEHWPDMADARWANEIHSYYRLKLH